MGWPFGGGGGGGIISNIANDVGSGVRGVANGVAGPARTDVTNNFDSNTYPKYSLGLPGSQIYDSSTGQWFGAKKPQQPGAPGLDPGLSQIQQQQFQQAQQFRQNLPQNEQNAFQNLSQTANRQLGQNLNAVNQNTNSRGLLYGGINQGMRAQERANTQIGLARGRENINDQYQNAANQMDAAAVNTGQMIQQNQQAIQDQIYNAALSNMMNTNTQLGGLIGGAGALIGYAAFA